MEQQIFVSSFYTYLNFHQTNDFIVDLDNIWKWLGFSSKQKARILLEKNFVIEKDYKFLVNQQVNQDKEQHGGHNKQIILLNIKTFKLLCIKAETKKANEIHEYYIKLEEVLQDIFYEESNELKLQLENHILSSQLEKELIKEKTLLEQFPNNTQCVYYGFIDNKSNDNEKLIKFGNSNNLPNRIEQHKRTFNNFRLINVFKVENKTQIENEIKNHKVLCNLKRVIKINDTNYTELLAIDKLSLEKIDKIIKEIIKNIEYSPENYLKLLEENKKLVEENKKLLEGTNNNKLLEENIKLKNIAQEFTKFKKTIFLKITEENNKLKIKYSDLIKKYKKLTINSEEYYQEDNDGEDNNEEDNDGEDNNGEDNNGEDNDEKIFSHIKLRKYQRHSDGLFYINGNTYEILTGTRQEVWDNIAFRTSGELTKKDLCINVDGKIVSKLKSKMEQKYYKNRFEKK